MSHVEGFLLKELYIFGQLVFLRFVGWGGGESGKSSLEILEEILTLKEEQQLFEASVTTRKDQTLDRSHNEDGDAVDDKFVDDNDVNGDDFDQQGQTLVKPRHRTGLIMMMTMIVTMMVVGMMMMLVGMKMTETTRRQLASDKSYNAKCLKCAGKDFTFVQSKIGTALSVMLQLCKAGGKCPSLPLWKMPGCQTS